MQFLFDNDYSYKYEALILTIFEVSPYDKSADPLGLGSADKYNNYMSMDNWEGFKQDLNVTFGALALRFQDAGTSIYELRKRLKVAKSREEIDMIIDDAIALVDSLKDNQN